MHQFMAQSRRPITTQEVRSHSHAMQDILSGDPHLEHAREERGLEAIQSVQVPEFNGHFRVFFASESKRVFVRSHSYQNIFHLQVQIRINHQTHFHMKGFKRKLVFELREAQCNSEIFSRSLP